MRKFNILGNLGIIFGAILSAFGLMFVLTSLSNIKEMMVGLVLGIIFLVIGLALLVMGIIFKKKSKGMRDDADRERIRKHNETHKPAPKIEPKSQPKPVPTVNKSSGVWTATASEIQRYLGKFGGGSIGYPFKANYYISDIYVKQASKTNTFEVEVGVDIVMLTKFKEQSKVDEFNRDAPHAGFRAADVPSVLRQ